MGSTYLTYGLLALALASTSEAFTRDMDRAPNGRRYGIELGHPGGNRKRENAFADDMYSSAVGKGCCRCLFDWPFPSTGPVHVPAPSHSPALSFPASSASHYRLP